MPIVFKRIPNLAIAFYISGFLLIAAAMLLFFYFPQTLSPVRVQQIFIGGAIIVALGSVINTLHQFKRPQNNNKE